MEGQDSIKFLVARSTDPFLQPSDRQSYFEKLLDQIKEQYDAPQTAFQLLSHKLLSPDQVETLQTLEVLDQLVRQAGSRVAVEVGKFKFLNNFIRLLSPKHQGLSTCEAVRHKATELLFLWKESLRHLEKIAQVYDLLKQQHIIEQDPQVQRPIPSIECSQTSPKLAAFEDQEKAQLLAELLRSSKPEDLQAANRMIKSMVRAEDQKLERYHKRKQVLESASSTAEALWSMLGVENAEDLDSLGFFNGNAPKQIDQGQYNIMKDLFESLKAFRPTLFRYASEASETSGGHENSSEEQSQWILADILALNDQINRTMQAFKEMKRCFPSPQPSSSTSKKSDLISICEWEGCHLDDVKILSSISPANSPAVDRRAAPTGPQKTGSLEREDPFAKDFPHNQLDNIIEELKDVDLMQTEPQELRPSKIPHKQHENGGFLLEDVSLTADQLEIVTSTDPIVFVQQNQLQALLYRSREKENYLPLLKSAIFYIVVINSTSPVPITNVHLEMSSANSLVNSRLLKASNTNLKAFNPISPVKNISQVFILLPLTDTIKKAEIQYSLTFEVQDQRNTKRSEGLLTVDWK